MPREDVHLTVREAAALAQVMPHTPAQLHAWVSCVLGVRVAREALTPGSSAPFAYLVHTFFEGRFDGEAEGGGAAPADCVVWACRGGGKTFLGAVATALDLIFKPGVQVRLLGGSLEQSRRMHEHLRRLFALPAMAPLLEGKITERRVILRNGSCAEVLAQSHTSVRGVRVQKLRCDEAELFDPEIWRAAQLVTRSMPCPGPWGGTVRGSVEALGTMHRPMGLMWRIVAETGADPARPESAAGAQGNPSAAHARRLFRWGLIDSLAHCPQGRPCAGCSLERDCAGLAKGRAAGEAGHISVDDASRLISRVDRATWESEMLCLRPTRTGAVLPEFDPRVHVYTGDGEGACGGTWVAGMDFGFRSPTVVVFGRHEAEGDVLRIVAEHAASERTLDQHAEAIRAAGLPAPVWIGVDPAGRQRSEQTGISAVTHLKRAGFSVRSRRMGLHEGLSLVRARLAPADSAGPRLFVHARCGRLIESLQRYRYPEDRPESLTPVKDGADHAVDALRYLIVNLDRPAQGRVGRWA